MFLTTLLGGRAIGGDVAVWGDGGEMLQIRVLPFLSGTDSGFSGRKAHVVVFLASPGCVSPAMGELATQFGLTPAEARLVGRLVEGRTLEQSAVDLGVAMTTIKSHLTAVFTKTGTRRQAELIALVLTSLAGLDRGSHT